jgi:hypothetical protein
MYLTNYVRYSCLLKCFSFSTVKTFEFLSCRFLKYKVCFLIYTYSIKQWHIRASHFYIVVIVIVLRVLLHQPFSVLPPYSFQPLVTTFYWQVLWDQLFYTPHISEIIQNRPFYAWFILFNIMISSSIPVVTMKRISFFCMSE